MGVGPRNPKCSMEGNAMTKCQFELRQQGKACPRTCETCGLGPCKEPRETKAEVEHTLSLEESGMTMLTHHVSMLSKTGILRIDMPDGTHVFISRPSPPGGVDGELLALLREFRDYAAKEITRGGAHHDPVWAKVAAAIAKAEATHTPSDAAEREELATWFEDEILGQVDLVGTGSEPGEEYRVKFNQKATRIAHLLRTAVPGVGEVRDYTRGEAVAFQEGRQHGELTGIELPEDVKSALRAFTVQDRIQLDFVYEGGSKEAISIATTLARFLLQRIQQRGNG